MAEVTGKTDKKIVGAALGYGILFLPFVFAWAVLAKGYSARVRGYSLAWLAVFSVIAIGGISRQSATGSGTDSAPPAISSIRSASADSSSPLKGSPAAPNTQPATATSDKVEVALPPSVFKPPPTAWTYSTTKDEMRGTSSKFAVATSLNSEEFGFPYGRQSMRLTLRERPSDGLNIILSTDAQFICSEYSQDYVSVKFDDEAVKNYGCSEAAAASSDTIFIKTEQSFLKKLRNAKKVIIEALFYDHGKEQFTFDAAGLKW